MKKKKAAITAYIIMILCMVGFLAMLVYGTLYGRNSASTADFTMSDAATLGLAAWAIPMWISSLLLMKALRLRGTLHEKQNKMLIAFPAMVCSGFLIFYIIVLGMMLFG
ncbi:MAG: hypothetical protein K5898_07275 [Ruminococcus sp.]|uniref:hypothetical protein n=1 Tax=Ruminococcus sp. TaxID=41978 RepID=UPI0025FEF630|nr:hypothetical protein [Ruminococcus sp.]MCR4794951.1 hypothetical protein [Ruminococcus sp.]